MLGLLFLPVVLAAQHGADEHNGGEAVKEVLLILSRIQASIEKEGATEAAGYDKFACFCKEQVDGKQYAIENAKAKEALMESQIDDASDEKDILDADALTLTGEVTQLNTDMADALADRNTENYVYGNRSTAVATGITAIETAIAHTKQAGMKVSLAELKRIAVAAGKQAPTVTYSEQSGEVVQAFEDLRDDFIHEKNEIDSAEQKSVQEYELLEAAQQRQADAKTLSASDKSQTSAALAIQIGADTATRDETETSRLADEAFLNDLTLKCEAKAAAWDQRSTVRAGEIKALSEAQEALAPAESTYGSTSKVGRQLGVLAQLPGRHHGQHKAAHHHHGAHKAAHQHKHEARKLEKALRGKTEAVAFVQTLVQTAVVRKAFLAKPDLRDELVQTLSKSAHAKKVVEAVQRKDAFSDVKVMLTDLVSDLRQEARDAKAQAVWCEAEMTRATTSRDGTVADIKGYAALTETKADLRDNLYEAVTGLETSVANLTKSLNEETELRAEDKAFNKQRLADATTGLAAVQNAITILETYYGSVADPEPLETAPDSTDDAMDSSNKTVDGMAPDSFEMEAYAGSQNAGDGAVAELEKIELEFQSTVTNTGTEESTAQTDFDTLEGEINADITAKNVLIKTKRGQKADAETAIDGAADDTAAAKELLEKTLAEITNLAPACQATLSGADARADARNQEIVVLNSALGILDGGLSFGNQTDF